MLFRRTYQVLVLVLLLATATSCSLFASFTGTFRFTYGTEGSSTTITATLTQVETAVTGQLVFETETDEGTSLDIFDVNALVRARGVAEGVLTVEGTTIMHPVLLLLSGNGQFLTVRLNDVGNFGYILTRAG